MKKSAAQPPDQKSDTNGTLKKEVQKKVNIKRQKREADTYPEEFEEFRSMDLRMKPQPFRRKNKNS